VRKGLGTMEEWLYILTRVNDDKLYGMPLTLFLEDDKGCLQCLKWGLKMKQRKVLFPFPFGCGA